MTEPAFDAHPEFGTRCAGCGAPFTCGVDAPGGCWCLRRPPLPATALRADAGCLCEVCLGRALAAAATVAG